MIVSEVKYLKRKNLGNYEHKELQVTVVNDSENPSLDEELIAYAMKLVESALQTKE
jgi:hypothetical protein